MPIKNVVFDLGRVLINWNPEKVAANFSTDPQLQKSICDNIFYHKNWEDLDEGLFTEEEALDRFAKATNLSKKEIDELMEQGRKSFFVKQETLNELLRLKEKYKIYCLSNMSIENWARIKSDFSFDKYFDGIVISAEVKLVKPDPAIYHHLLNQYKLIPEETIFIDDLSENIKTAEKLGIRGIRFDESEKCFEKIREI